MFALKWRLFSFNTESRTSQTVVSDSGEKSITHLRFPPSTFLIFGQSLPNPLSSPLSETADDVDSILFTSEERLFRERRGRGDVARIMGLQRRIYFSSIRALHIGRSTGWPGMGERKGSPGILHRVRDTLHESSGYDENSYTTRDNDVASMYPSRIARANVKFLYIFTGWIESRWSLIRTWTIDWRRTENFSSVDSIFQYRSTMRSSMRQWEGRIEFLTLDYLFCLLVCWYFFRARICSNAVHFLLNIF